VRLAANEGGMNITMPAEVIEKIMKLGTLAGEKLNGFDFEQHRWVRFVVIMAELERELMELLRTLTGGKDDTYERLLREDDLSKFPFTRDQPWRQQAVTRIAKIRENLQAIYPERKAFFNDDLVPVPRPVKRLVPRE
jgi:hypothetical protein